MTDQFADMERERIGTMVTLVYKLLAGVQQSRSQIIERGVSTVKSVKGDHSDSRDEKCGHLGQVVFLSPGSVGHVNILTIPSPHTISF